MIKVGITGGIGSGKTTACRLFAALDVPVYDSDRRAKELMEQEPLRGQLIDRFGSEIYSEGHLNRPVLARRVFCDPAELAALNARVHPAVIADFRGWAAAQAAEKPDYILLETALLFESGLDKEVDFTVALTAPPELRIARTCQRDGATPEEVQRRMAAQLTDDELTSRANFVLPNTTPADLEQQVARLDKIFRDAAHK